MKQTHFPKCSVFCCWNDIFLWLCFVGYSLGTWKASEPREPRAKRKTAFGWGSRAEMADWWLGLVKGCASVLHEACDPAKLDCCVEFRVNIRLFVSGSFSQHELLALIFDVLQSCQQKQPWCFHCYIWGFVFDSQTETHTHTLPPILSPQLLHRQPLPHSMAAAWCPTVSDSQQAPPTCDCSSLTWNLNSFLSLSLHSSWSHCSFTSHLLSNTLLSSACLTGLPLGRNHPHTCWGCQL